MSAEPWRRSGTPVAPRLFCVAGALLWGPQAGFAWQVWYFGGLCRCPPPVAPRLFVWQAWYFGGLRLDLRGKCGTFETFVDVRGTLATKRDPCRY